MIYIFFILRIFRYFYVHLPIINISVSDTLITMHSIISLIYYISVYALINNVRFNSTYIFI